MPSCKLYVFSALLLSLVILSSSHKHYTSPIGKRRRDTIESNSDVNFVSKSAQCIDLKLKEFYRTAIEDCLRDATDSRKRVFFR
ncbi:hypothetical protein AC249_AIPGENE25616 [Exaiptasia diaphana]|nr:hypothetical protein AC249_AIPGENE25616 [Exaiptasia diaphana]